MSGASGGTAEPVAKQVVVSGDVQGVFFRDSTRQRAKQHGVVGWIRNDADGTVTAHLEGPEDGVAAVIEWIRAGGPPAARVGDVAVTDDEVTGAERFTIRQR